MKRLGFTAPGSELTSFFGTEPGDSPLKSPRSSREVRRRVPFFGFGYFSRATLPTKKRTVRKGT